MRVIQWIIEVPKNTDPEACLKIMAGQDGYLGGRLLPGKAGKPTRAQGLFDASGLPAGAGVELPEGMRLVIVPDAQLASLGIVPGPPGAK